MGTNLLDVMYIVHLQLVLKNFVISKHTFGDGFQVINSLKNGMKNSVKDIPSTNEGNILFGGVKV